MPRHLRRIAAFIALVSLLFVQLAVTAHACDRLVQQGAAPAMATHGDRAADMPGCPDEGPANASLCQEHCDPGQGSLDRFVAGEAVPFIGPSLAYHVADVQVPPLQLVSPAAPFFLIRTTAPPLAVRNCCFRI